MTHGSRFYLVMAIGQAYLQLLAGIGVVVLQAWFGQLCPLTLWENELRRPAGQSGYTETFVEYWLHEVLFYQAEPWVFTSIYTCFGVLVVLVWFLGKRRRRLD